jgi:hypothetical protein
VISRRIATSCKEYESPQSFIERFCVSPKEIQSYGEAAYLTFKDKFGHGSDLTERINFEVTFMTRSYVDEEITVPACANRKSRTPRSMVLWPEDKTIYRETETAKIYRGTLPSPLLCRIPRSQTACFRRSAEHEERRSLNLQPAGGTLGKYLTGLPTKIGRFHCWNLPPPPWPLGGHSHAYAGAFDASLESDSLPDEGGSAHNGILGLDFGLDSFL